MEGTQHGSTPGEVLAQISTGLVQLHSRYHGKGPTKAKNPHVEIFMLEPLGDPVAVDSAEALPEVR